MTTLDEGLERAASDNHAVALPLDLEWAGAFWEAFHCQRCGKCCTGDICKGAYVSTEVVANMAVHLGMSTKQFKKRYTYTDNGRRYVLQPCPFYQDGVCKLYHMHNARPTVCRIFPLDIPVDGKLTVNARCPEALTLARTLWKSFETGLQQKEAK